MSSERLRILLGAARELSLDAVPHLEVIGTDAVPGRGFGFLWIAEL